MFRSFIKVKVTHFYRKKIRRWLKKFGILVVVLIMVSIIKLNFSKPAFASTNPGYTSTT